MRAKVRLVTRRSGIHGRGVFAACDIPAGVALIEYKGRRLRHEEADRLYAGGAETGHTFLFTLNEDWIIDASVGGNQARWINHSCDPNCQAVLHEDPRGRSERDRVIIESLRPIRAGEELCYDYGIRLEERHTPRLKRIWACRCGAANCTGTLLRPKR
ncbi:MAG: SET domain-containing protein-lysine N-methyltransferase [Lysobacteraceae bacterium]|nr:MAG: SET domain-containing protein-lysine N-methyltransferase [Xanthomonadaceae bacterium]